MQYMLASGVGRIDDSLLPVRPAACDDAESEAAGENDVDDLFEHVTEYKKARDAVIKMYPDSELRMFDAADRPSRGIRETARIRATIDILTQAHDMHMPECSRKSECRCHALADVSQRADRAKFHVDGSVPTLTTGSRIFSYKLRRMLTSEELLLSMGYSKKANLTPFAATAKRTLVGNGYCVPVCALAVAAVATVAGHVTAIKSRDAGDRV